MLKYDVVWRIPKSIPISYKKYFSLKIDTITKSWPFRMKHVIEGGYLFEPYIYNYFIIPMYKWSYSFIHYLIVEVISFHQLSYRFSRFSGVWKENREYEILHQMHTAWLESFFSCKHPCDVASMLGQLGSRSLGIDIVLLSHRNHWLLIIYSFLSSGLFLLHIFRYFSMDLKLFLLWQSQSR